METSSRQLYSKLKAGQKPGTAGRGIPALHTTEERNPARKGNPTLIKAKPKSPMAPGRWHLLRLGRASVSTRDCFLLLRCTGVNQPATQTYVWLLFFYF